MMILPFRFLLCSSSLSSDFLSLAESLISPFSSVSPLYFFQSSLLHVSPLCFPFLFIRIFRPNIDLFNYFCFVSLTASIPPSVHPPLRLVARGVVGSCQYTVDWTGGRSRFAAGAAPLTWQEARRVTKEKKKPGCVAQTRCQRSRLGWLWMGASN